MFLIIEKDYSFIYRKSNYYLGFVSYKVIKEEVFSLKVYEIFGFRV